jgi:tetratricopeptide (TPR) repeat protein
MTQKQKFDTEILSIEKALESARLEEAQFLLNQMLQVTPQHPRANELLAYLFAARGQQDKAFEQLRMACQLQGALPSAFYALGRQYLDTEQFQDAISHLQISIDCNGKFIEGLHDLGIAYAGSGNLNKARETFEDAQKIWPSSAEISYNLGRIYDDLKMIEEASKSYQDAINKNPYLAEAYINLGDVNVEQCSYDVAINNYDAALQIDPTLVDALVNRGVVFHISKQFDQALSSYDRAISINKDCAGAHFNKALTLIALGRYAEGWKEYEWRWLYERFRSPTRRFTQPLWLGGQALDKKTLLIHSEQGLGDTIQFSRYLNTLKNKGGQIYIEVEDPLIPLLDSMSIGAVILKKGSELPKFDYHCPMMSLPLALNLSDSELLSSEKYLQAEDELIAVWKERLGTHTLPRVGVVWSGSTDHQNNKNRNIPLEKFLLHLPRGPQYISLQKEPTKEEKEILNCSKMITDYSDLLKSFKDTAALISCLDLVIGVDTSTIHLSGALGVRTWLLLSYVQDWRWPSSGDESAWYSSMRIFRQSQDQNWDPVLERLGWEMSPLINQKSELKIENK